MHTYPHRPDMRSRAQEEKRIVLARARLLSRGLPADASLAAEQTLLLAAMAYADEMSIPTVIGLVREALGHFHVALDSGHHPSPHEMRSYLLTALLVDLALAHFIASVPEQLWEHVHNRSLYPLMIQVKALIAILQRSTSESRRWVGASHAILTEEQPLEYANLCLDDIRNFHDCLEAVHEEDSTRFNAALKIRTEIRAASFARNGRNSHLGLLDLDGLGLCALARNRGMTVTVHHVYLPLELLDAAEGRPDEPRKRK